jgi:hypothetical protein
MKHRHFRRSALREMRFREIEGFLRSELQGGREKVANSAIEEGLVQAGRLEPRGPFEPCRFSYLYLFCSAQQRRYIGWG